MEREDLLSLAAGLIIVLVIALFIKPMISDGPIDVPTPDLGQVQTTTVPTPAPLTPAPTPTQAWDGKVHEIGFVDPATYHLNITDEQVRWRETPASEVETKAMIPYATIRGTGSGTTEIIHIPVPYWELRYDVDPYNTNYGYLNVQVMDAADPNRFVRIVTLQRPDLILGENATAAWKADTWKETFYEGQRDYWFVINTRCIRSYTLEVLVPEKYVPQNLA